MHWALHETPGIIEFCLDGDVRLGELLLVLEAEDLEEVRRGDWEEDRLYEIPRARRMKGRPVRLLRRGVLWTLWVGGEKEREWGAEFKNTLVPQPP